MVFTALAVRRLLLITHHPALLVHRWRGWPASRAGGGRFAHLKERFETVSCLLFPRFPSSPSASSEGGHDPPSLG